MKEFRKGLFLNIPLFGFLGTLLATMGYGTSHWQYYAIFCISLIGIIGNFLIWEK